MSNSTRTLTTANVDVFNPRPITNSEGHTLSLLIDFYTAPYGPYVNFTLRPVWVTADDKPRNPDNERYYTEPKGALVLGYLKVEASGSNDDAILTDATPDSERRYGARRFYGYQPQVEHYTGLDLARCREALHTLETIHKRLDKIEAVEGAAQDFAEFARRFARAIGCATMIWQSSGTSFSYAENEYTVLPLASGEAKIRREEDAWRRGRPSTFLRGRR